MKSLLNLLVLFLLSLTAAAQWSTSPAVNNQICGLAGEQAIPKVAICPNGDCYICYFSNEGGNYNVRLQRLDAAGNTQWTAGGILVSGHPQETWLTDWDMTADGTGHAILAFNDIRTGNTNVVAYRISPSGNFVWGPDGILLSNTTAFNAAPVVRATAAGNIVVAWSADNVSIMQKLDPAGNKLWGPAGKTVSSSNRITWPQLLPTGNDDVILKYFDDAGMPNAPTRHVFAQRYDPAGTAVWSAPAAISLAGGISAWTQIFPMVSDGNEGFFITWHDDRDNNQRASTFVQHISGTGQVLFAANGVECSSASSMNHYYPALAVPQGSTDVYVFWNEMNTLQSQWGIYGQKVDASGAVQWGPTGTVLIPVSATNVYPYAARGTATDVILVYEQYFDAINGSIKAMRVSPAGAMVWSPALKDICTVNSQKIHPEVSEFADNQLIVGWEDSRNTDTDIYAQNIQLDGSLGPVLMGFIQGQVNITGEPVDVTQADVTNGSITVHPDFTGHYSMQVAEGTYTVTASHPYTTSQIIGNVQVTAGIPTTGVNFNLTVNRADLVVDAVDNWGGYVNNVTVAITGPEGVLNGIITHDTIVFRRAAYGTYDGTATYATTLTSQADTLLSAQNHNLRFQFIFSGMQDDETVSGLSVEPNPVRVGSVGCGVRFGAAREGTCRLTLTDARGQRIGQCEVQAAAGQNRTPLSALTGGKTLSPGIYLLRLESPDGKTYLCKLICERD